MKNTELKEIQASQTEQKATEKVLSQMGGGISLDENN